MVCKNKLKIVKVEFTPTDGVDKRLAPIWAKLLAACELGTDADRQDSTVVQHDKKQVDKPRIARFSVDG